MNGKIALNCAFNDAIDALKEAQIIANKRIHFGSLSHNDFAENQPGIAAAQDAFRQPLVHLLTRLSQAGSSSLNICEADYHVGLSELIFNAEYDGFNKTAEEAGTEAASHRRDMAFNAHAMAAE